MQKGATNLNNQQQQTSTSSNNSAKVKCNMLFTIFGDNDKMLIDFFDSIKNKAVLEKSRPSNSAINPIIHVAMDQKSLDWINDSINIELKKELEKLGVNLTHYDEILHEIENNWRKDVENIRETSPVEAKKHIETCGRRVECFRKLMDNGCETTGIILLKKWFMENYGREECLNMVLEPNNEFNNACPDSLIQLPKNHGATIGILVHSKNEAARAMVSTRDPHLLSSLARAHNACAIYDQQSLRDPGDLLPKIQTDSFAIVTWNKSDYSKKYVKKIDQFLELSTKTKLKVRKIDAKNSLNDIGDCKSRSLFDEYVMPTPNTEVFINYEDFNNSAILDNLHTNCLGMINSKTLDCFESKKLPNGKTETTYFQEYLPLSVPKERKLALKCYASFSFTDSERDVAVILPAEFFGRKAKKITSESEYYLPSFKSLPCAPLPVDQQSANQTKWILDYVKLHSISFGNKDKTMSR